MDYVFDAVDPNTGALVREGIHERRIAHYIDEPWYAARAFVHELERLGRKEIGRSTGNVNPVMHVAGRFVRLQRLEVIVDDDPLRELPHGLLTQRGTQLGLADEDG